MVRISKEEWAIKEQILGDLIARPEKLESVSTTKLLSEFGELNDELGKSAKLCSIFGVDVNIIKAESILIELSKRKLDTTKQKKLDNLRKIHQGKIIAFHSRCICTYDEETERIIYFTQELQQIKEEEREILEGYL